MSKPSAKPVKEQRTLSLSKGKHTYVFKYELGSEQQLLQALADMVKRRELPFDWFDAAVLSHQLGQQLSKELSTLLPKNDI